MLILHASWFEGRLLVWGENSEKKRRKKRLPVSPYDAGPDGLKAVLKDLDGESGTGGLLAESAVAWLPSSDDRPLPSHPLIDDMPDTPKEGQLEPWVVTVAPMAGMRRDLLLAVCASRRQAGQNVLQPGVVIGDDVYFWANALRFAWSLIVRQQYVPVVTQASGNYVARWRPFYLGSDGQRLHELLRSMPPSARAIHRNREVPPTAPARKALQEFLSLIVDEVARSANTGIQRRGDGVHDRWIAALQSPNGVFTSHPKDLEALNKQFREWQRPLEIISNAPFRLCFRLREPDLDPSGPNPAPRPGEERWRVDYLMQGTADPSLMLQAADVWGSQGLNTAAERLGATARENLVISLGQAAGIVPAVEQSLRRKAPEGFGLSTDEAHAFLKNTAGALEQSGFGVLLPNWWTHKDPSKQLSVRVTVKSPMQGGVGLSMNSVLEFEYEAALGGELLSLADLKLLARMKTPLVRFRGQWIEVKASQIHAAIAFFERKTKSTGTLGDAVRMSIGAGAEIGPLPVESVNASGWVEGFFAALQSRSPVEDLLPPAGLTGTLRPYQTRGYSWLDFLAKWGLGACLADDMGLGKTIQTLALLQRRFETGARQGPVLLICPTSVVGNWQKEAARFTPRLTVMVHHGADRKRGAAFKKEAKKHHVVLSSYALLFRDYEELGGVEWDGIILDEAQNIKNPETKQARAVRALPAGYRIALTGTPVENNVGELWSLFEFLNPGLLGKQTEFKERFFLPIQLRGDAAATETLKKITSPFILRRLKTDKSIIADLPEKLEMKVFCNLTKEQASLYEAVVKEAEKGIDSSEGIQRKGIVLATIAKLKQVCNHPAQFLKDQSALTGRSGKLSRLVEMLEEALSAGDKALVFTQFAEMGHLLKQHLEESFGREALFLHGGVPQKHREFMVERFMEPDGPPVFLLSLKAGGTGLNLVGANHVFHFDRWWNPAVENQATDRAFRIGQTRNVQVHKFICVGTLEEKIDAMIERKKHVAERVVGAGEGWITELSNEELKELFALRPDAIGE